MIEVKLYGPVSSTNEYVKLLLKHKVESLGLNAIIIEKSEIDDLLKDGIASVPAVVVDKCEPMYINEITDTVSFVQDVVKTIIRRDINSENLGIIVPIDLSDASIKALEYAIQFAKISRSTIKVVHFYHPVVTEIDGTVYVDPNEEKNRREIFETFMSEICSHHNAEKTGGVIIHGEFQHGFSIEGILEISRADQRQLIIMGATGTGRLSKKIFGSVSTEIARRSECPVLIVPEVYDNFKIKNIALALETNKLNKKDIGFLQFLKNSVDAHLEIVTITEEEGIMPNWSIELDDLTGRNFIQGKFIYSKNVLDGLESYIENNDVDMLICTPKKRNVFESIFHKSVTKNMAINSHIPLLILHHRCTCTHGGSCCKFSAAQSAERPSV